MARAARKGKRARGRKAVAGTVTPFQIPFLVLLYDLLAQRNTSNCIGLAMLSLHEMETQESIGKSSFVANPRVFVQLAPFVCHRQVARLTHG